MNNLFKSKKTICVFAHPDDETMGPGGTIAKLSKNIEVQLICITDGDSPDTTVKNLSEIRKKELEASSKFLGISKIHYLDYKDGSLCNANYHEVGEKIQKILEEENPDTLITFEPHGMTGHIDHIAATMVTTFVFEKLNSIENLYYYCLSDKARKLIPEYFIYFPSGYNASEVDLVVNTTDVWDTQVQALNCHQSQIGDVQRILEMSKSLKKEEYFLKFKRVN